jgi:HAE1 family hydrophobic/amphiphilic exporter-1
MSLPRLAVRRPVTTLMIYVILTALGVYSFLKLPVDLLPDANPGTLTVHIGVRGGLPPEDIENLVTKPVEEAVASSQRLRDMISVSRKDRSVVTLTFEPGTDVNFAALEVQERLAKIKNKLPRDIEKPIVAHYGENDYPVLILALTSKDERYNPEVLRTLVDQKMKPVLARISGVANIEVGGGRERKILVEFDQSRLSAMKLSIRQVISSIGSNNLNLLSGRVDEERLSQLVRVQAAYQTVEDIKKLPVVVTREGSQILLEQVADVKDFFMEAQSYSRLNGEKNVSVYIQKDSQGNTIRTAKRIRDQIDKFKADPQIIPPGVETKIISDKSVFIADAVNNVTGNLTWGALLTWLVILMFFKEWKHTTLVFVSVPIAVLITFSCMHLFHVTLNSMTLMALALGIGMIVDSASVVLDNILDAKRRALCLNPGADLTEPTIRATEELYLSLLGSTLTIGVVFLPIVFINQQVKILYSGLAFTIIVSMFASLFVAVTLVPLVAARIPLPGHSGILSPGAVEALQRHGDAAWSRVPGRLKSAAIHAGNLSGRAAGRVAAYAPRVGKGWALLRERVRTGWARLRWEYQDHPRRLFVRWSAYAMRDQKALFTMMALLTGLCAATYLFWMDKDFLGSTEQNEFIIFVELPAGSKLDVSDKVVREVEELLAKVPTVAKHTKSAASRVEGWSSKIYVTLVSQKERDRSVQDVITELRPKVRDIGAEYNTFIYFSEPESSKEFVIDVFGPDYGKLKDLALAIAQRLEGVNGLTDVKLRYKEGRPEVCVVVDKDRASLFGLTVKDIAETLHAQIRGLRATFLNTGASQTEVVSRSLERFRKTIEDVDYLPMTGQEGVQVPIKSLATMDRRLTPSEVWRKSKQRMIQVSGNRQKMALSAAAKKVLRALKGLRVETGYYYQVGGDYENMLENEREFRFAFLVMVGLVFAVLAGLFESVPHALVIMTTIPMGLIGAIPLLYFTKTPITMSVFIGMILLGGIVVSAAIILVEKINQARAEGRELKRAVLEAGWMRLSPILNTSLTTIVDLIPMAFDKSESSQLWVPLALTVIGGATVSTFLTLFMVPPLYYHATVMMERWGSPGAPKFPLFRFSIPPFLSRVFSK